MSGDSDVTSDGSECNGNEMANDGGARSGSGDGFSNGDGSGNETGDAGDRRYETGGVSS